MNRVTNYFKVVFTKTKYIYILVSLLLIYILTRFPIYIKNYNIARINFYDFFIGVLGNYTAIAYFITFIYILYIYNIVNKHKFYQYILVKFKSKKQWLNINIFMILFMATAFVLILIFFAVLVSIPSLDFNNHWSDYSVKLSNSMVNYSKENRINVYQFIINTISPIKFTIITTIYIIMYLTTLGLVYLILSLLFKKKIFSVIGLLVNIIMNVGLYCSESIILKKISFYYNIILIDAYNINLNYSLYWGRLLYWLLMIFTLIFTGHIIVSKFDANYEEGSK